MTARGIGPGLVLGAVLGGVALGEQVGPSPARAALAVAVIGLLVAVVRRGIAGLVACCLAAVCGGGALTSRALDGLTRSPLSIPIEQRASAWIDATLVTDPVRSPFSARALARVERARIDGRPAVGAGGRHVLVDAADAAAPRLGVLRAGDRVRLSGYFRPLDASEARWRWRHVVGVFEASGLLGFRPPRSPLMALANWLRARVLAGHRSLPGVPRALVAGFLLGETVDLPAPVLAEFRAAGMSHLLAVSGQNVAFVLALAGPVLRRLGRPGRVGGGAAVLVLFAAMTRFEPSVLRACAMAGCSMLALALGRPTAGVRALALAAIGLLLVDPFLVHSVGFILSCSATLGIAVLGPSISRAIRGPQWWRETLAVTLGAQIGVAPVLIATFGPLSLVSIPANVLVAPIVGPLAVAGLVSGTVGGLLAEPLRSVLAFPVWLLASVVLAVARVAAAVPIAVGLGRSGIVVIGTTGLFAWWRIRRATWPRVVVPPG